MTKWSNAFSFILSSIGAAVGLGSLWFLPYQVYSYGGGAFFLLFSLFTVSLSPLMLGIEFALGRKLGCSLYTGLPKISKAFGRPISYFFYFTLICIFSFYAVVTSQTLFCFLNQMVICFQSGPISSASLLSPLEQSLPLSLSLLAVFWSLIYWVLSQPIKKGLERFSTVFIVLLVISLLSLIFHAAREGLLPLALEYLTTVKSEDLTPEGVLAAFGASLFGLAVGAGCMMSYGAYLKEKLRISLIGQVAIIAISCLFISTLSCLSLFPYVLSMPESFQPGPSFVFEVLPRIFTSLSTAGDFLGLIYLFALFCAGFTSCFSLMEPFILLLEEKCLFSRKKATLRSLLFFLFCSSLIVIESFTLGTSLVALIIHSVTSYFLPLGVLFTLFLFFQSRDSGQ